MKTIEKTEDRPRPLLRLIQGGLASAPALPLVAGPDEDEDDLEDDDLDDEDDLDEDEEEEGDDDFSVRVLKSPTERYAVGALGTLAIIERSKSGTPRTVHFGPKGSELGSEIPSFKFATKGSRIELTSDEGRWSFEVMS